MPRCQPTYLSIGSKVLLCNSFYLLISQVETKGAVQNVYAKCFWSNLVSTKATLHLKLLHYNLGLYYEIFHSLPQCAITAIQRHDGTYKLFSRHSWYIAIAHIHFFWSACKARNFNPISRVEIAWLVCWWCDGWRSQYSARLVSKICIKYILEIKTSSFSFCSRICTLVKYDHITD